MPALNLDLDLDRTTYSFLHDARCFDVGTAGDVHCPPPTGVRLLSHPPVLVGAWSVRCSDADNSPDGVFFRAVRAPRSSVAIERTDS